MAPILTGSVPAGELLNSANFILTVPLYQRDYQWLRRHVYKLLADIVYLARNSKEVHLLGNVILSETGRTSTIASTQMDWWKGFTHECEIVDGQQRCTTLVILCAAIQAKLHERANAEQDPTVKGELEKLRTSIEKRMASGCMFKGKEGGDFQTTFSFASGASGRLKIAANSQPR